MASCRQGARGGHPNRRGARPCGPSLLVPAPDGRSRVRRAPGVQDLWRYDGGGVPGGHSLGGRRASTRSRAARFIRAARQCGRRAGERSWRGIRRAREVRPREKLADGNALDAARLSLPVLHRTVGAGPDAGPQHRHRADPARACRPRCSRTLRRPIPRPLDSGPGFGKGPRQLWGDWNPSIPGRLDPGLDERREVDVRPQHRAGPASRRVPVRPERRPG